MWHDNRNEHGTRKCGMRISVSTARAAKAAELCGDLYISYRKALRAGTHIRLCFRDDKQNREEARKCGFEILLSMARAQGAKPCVGLIHKKGKAGMQDRVGMWHDNRNEHGTRKCLVLGIINVINNAYKRNTINKVWLS